MTNNATTIVIGSRGSPLALWQANYLKTALTQSHVTLSVSIKIIKTKGDIIFDQALSKIGDKGLFTKEIETALLEGDIDLAVHSHKDLPTVSPEGLIIGAIPQRANAADVLITKKATSLNDLAKNTIILTGSLRRSAQIKHLRPDITTEDIRGNIQTRLQKFEASNAGAFMMAAAAVDRLNLSHLKAIQLDPHTFIPACAQGALAIQIRTNDDHVAQLIAPLNHKETEITVTAERAFLHYLAGGCQTPMGAYCHYKDGQLALIGMIASLDGKQFISQQINGSDKDPKALGILLAKALLAKGGVAIVASLQK